MIASSEEIPFIKSVQSFLIDLAKNNSRTWFSDHKTRYERDLKEAGSTLCAEINKRLEATRSEPHAFKVYRLHRDLRFSKDKTPFNTHFRASFGPLIGQEIDALWHFSIEPKLTRFGAGRVMFSKTDLAVFRQKVAAGSGRSLETLVSELQQQGLRVSVPELKRLPPTFSTAVEHAALLRRKSLTVWRDVPDFHKRTNAEFFRSFDEFIAQAHPLIDWLSITSGKDNA